MTFRRPQFVRASLWLYAVGFLGMHAVCMVFFPARATQISAAFLVVAPAVAAAVGFFCAHISDPSVRRQWYLFAIALSLWAFASIMSAREVISLNLTGNSGAPSQIAYFMYGVPILLAIATPTEGSWNVMAIWLDGIQIAILGFLTYMVTFSAVPFSHQHLHPVAATTAALTFNIENIVLACAATLRLLSTSPRTRQRRFHRNLTSFLWIYAILVGLYNHLDVINPNTGLFDLLVDLPFLVLVLLVLLPRRRPAKDIMFRFGESLAILIDNASPTLFPAAILALGIYIARDHFAVGVSSIAFSVAVYGIRSTLLQLDLQRAQMEARLARDSMEIAALTDPLTGVANRRHFDRFIHSEWNRLTRDHGTFSLLLIDIDYFKLLNDAFGHAEGDMSLRQVANGLNAALQREHDMLARYGGEEFAAILPGADREGAEAVAQRMRNTLAGLRLRNRTPLGNTLTVSIGACTCNLPCHGAIEDLFNAADRALYAAKQNGRDRIKFELIQPAKIPRP